MTDPMFPCHSIPFSEEGLDNYDRIFGNKNEEEHEDNTPVQEESGGE